MDDPEQTLRAAFASLAAGEFDELLSLLDEETLANARGARLAVVRDTLRRARGDAKQLDQLRLLLESWGVIDEDDIASHDPIEIARRGLTTLPGIRRTIRCQVLGKTFEDSDVATVTFKVGWQDAAPEEGVVHRAHLKRGVGGWRIRSNLLNPWLLPGFENVLFAGTGD